jgi:hypothetical protein
MQDKWQGYYAGHDKDTLGRQFLIIPNRYTTVQHAPVFERAAWRLIETQYF